MAHRRTLPPSGFAPASAGGGAAPPQYSTLGFRAPAPLHAGAGAGGGAGTSAPATTLFAALFTTQKTKKVKQWKEGVLVATGRRARLFAASAEGERTGNVLATLSLSAAAEANPAGLAETEHETEGFLVQIGELLQPKAGGGGGGGGAGGAGGAGGGAGSAATTLEPAGGGSAAAAATVG